MKTATEVRKVAEAVIAEYNQKVLNELEIEIDTRASGGEVYVDVTYKIGEGVKFKLEQLGYKIDHLSNPVDFAEVTRISW